jgi:hypothetical protein
MKTWNFVEATGAIAVAEELSPRFVPTLLRRIRLFDKYDLLPTQREEAGRREGRLDFYGLYLAAVFSELVDFGFDVETLRALKAQFDRQSDIHWKSRFQAAADFVSTGKLLIMQIDLCLMVGEEKRIHCSFLDKDFNKAPFEPNTTERVEKAINSAFPSRSSLRTNLTDLLSPLAVAG